MKNRKEINSPTKHAPWSTPKIQRWAPESRPAEQTNWCPWLSWWPATVAMSPVHWTQPARLPKGTATESKWRLAPPSRPTRWWWPATSADPCIVPRRWTECPMGNCWGHAVRIFGRPHGWRKWAIWFRWCRSGRAGKTAIGCRRAEGFWGFWDRSRWANGTIAWARDGVCPERMRMHNVSFSLQAFKTIDS